ncbi:hypothetical protein [Runella salmonicolor]|uniref:Uncharacterized protein n=1 Tax=Runella salmonicolor TaxID=2950278 RepID=A0ABT1FRQ3_9BACT|nr:hypothetical protein [Runella salmonicolor]MCP1384444.1 hypothetical protein [Runella salmonicolor]
MLAIVDEKQAHKLDIYLEHLNPNIRRPLPKKQADTLDKYWKIFGWRCKLFSPEATRKLIMQEWSCSYSWACEMYGDMEYIFGKTEEINKNVHRRILLEHYYTALTMAVQGKNSDPLKAAQVICNISDKIAQLLGIGEESQQIPPELLMPKRQVTYFVGTMNVQMNTPHEPTAIPLPPNDEEI